MRRSLSLFPRILLWFLLSIAVLLFLMVGVFNFQLRLSPLSPLRALSAEGLDSVARLIEQDLNQSGRSRWDEVLRHRSQAYGVDFVLVDEHGSHLAGKRAAPPDGLLRGIPGPGSAHREGGPRPSPPDGSQPPHGRFVVRSEDPVRYWGGVPVFLHTAPGERAAPAVLIAVSDRRDGHGLFFDARPWLIAGTALLLVSILMWVPLVRSLARPIIRLTSVTEQIARGEFDARLETKRADEIGRLGAAINDMTARLGRFVRGQRRFLADVAHELSSPIARLEMALGILKQGAPCTEETIEDIGEDVEHMAELVQELLLYVRAEQGPSNTTVEPTQLRPLVMRAVRRECGEETPVQVEIDDSVVATANPPLLTRAVANLLRNSSRYAAGSPITVRARERGGSVLLEVRDEGPGVPDGALEQLFDPFYRPDDSRLAETGGVGLGLAIVRTCVEACGGRATARNSEPHGLSVLIELQAAQERSAR